MPQHDDAGLRKRLGQMVRDARNRRGWTQLELGRRIGLSQPAISDIERGGWTAGENLDALAKALELPIGKFSDARDLPSAIAAVVPTMDQADVIDLVDFIREKGYRLAGFDGPDKPDESNKK